MMSKIVASRRASVSALAVATVAGCLLMTEPAWGQTFSDDFNRPSGTDLGPNWVERTGDLQIVGDSILRNAAQNAGSSMTVVNFNTTQPALSIDASYASQSSLDVAYVGLYGRYA